MTKRLPKKGGGIAVNKKQKEISEFFLFRYLMDLVKMKLMQKKVNK